MGKKKMPTAAYFLKKKTIYGKKKDPVWVYLEREMQQNVDKKPYNQRVGNWLKFLRDLKHHYYCEAKMKYLRLNREVGPLWYYEFAENQRATLGHMKSDMHQDLIEDTPSRIKQCLWDLGITTKFPTEMLMHAMDDSIEDPGVFLWVLFTMYYKNPPSELLPKYDMNAKLLLSAIVFADLDECIERLNKLAKIRKEPPTPPKNKKKKYYEPKVKFGMYLQKMYVPLYPPPKSKKDPTVHLEYRIRLRSPESYENISKSTAAISLEKRRERNKKEKKVERICTYKFWEPPTALRNDNPDMVAYIQKLRMFKLKGRPTYQKFKPPFENIQCLIGCLSYSGGRPRYLLHNFFTLPTGYIIFNGGVVKFRDEYILNILGKYKFPADCEDKCATTCDCVAVWEERIMKYIDNSRCKCHHNYCYQNTGKPDEKCFYPPTRHGSHWFDFAKIYNFNPVEDFVKEKVYEALTSAEPTICGSDPTLSPGSLNARQLVAAFLGDLMQSPLLIPHLPQADLLKSLQEWVRLRIKGKMSPSLHQQKILQSQRRWLDLKHMDFRARAYRIPFTLKQIQNMNYSHRSMIRKLANTLRHSFDKRNKNKQVEQTRLWWPTMEYDAYPNKAFLNVFFTYLPGRMKDTFVINPYSVERTLHCEGKTCPLPH